MSTPHPDAVDREGATELAPAAPPSDAQPTPVPRSRPPSSASLEGGRFAPGEMLGGRYRIVELLGQGGMGEVYRAEDLLLGQRVALKFLPAALAGDNERMERLLAEVRLARQVSHPNVCRVYDVGEADGHTFFSMELVEGDDLATLLRQVGRFPAEKGLEIARQLCAGLAAAHDRGVVHRDLKPGNVLVDRNGRVHVADFGLALAGSATGGEALAGSPGYMAPEQLAGREATTRSDLFALGIVLYELFTGKRAYRADSLAELRRRVDEGPPTPPSEVVPGFDPAIERAILRCLEHEPRDRPSSALAVSAALPGGDPLAAALAAGETPSPEMVAAAGGVGVLAPARAALLAGGALLLAIAAAAAIATTHAARFIPVDRPPDYLDQRARDILSGLGHQTPVQATAAHWNWVRPSEDLAAKLGKLGLGRALRSGRVPVLFRTWRQNPQDFSPPSGFAVVRRFEPRPFVPGEAQVDVDTLGRLIGLVIVQPEHDPPPPRVPAPRWDALFAAAGLPMSAFRPVTPEWNPSVVTDARAAWIGEAPELPGVPLRVEAGAYRGKPVHLKLIWPWTRTPGQVRESRGASQRLAETLNALLSLLLLSGAFFAWRNVRLGRGDRRGAFRIAAWFFVCHTIVWLGEATHSHSLPGEWFIIQRDLGFNLFLAAMLWVGYVAVEPYVRRQWPETLISWSRLLGARFADPRVGRDVLVGVGMGSSLALLQWLGLASPAWRAGRSPGPFSGFADRFAFDIVDQLVHAVLDSMLVLFVLLFLLLVLRRRWPAVAAALLVLSAALVGDVSDGDWLGVLITVLFTVVAVVGLTRFGLVALATASFVQRLIAVAPWTFDASAWYAWEAGLAGAVLLASLVFGFRTATAGAPLFARPLET
ncbi:MAG TPA: serine/threonine-protein kinase [Thermoanaerobaculia bacterium]|nr:serine/threonine-protein kinase [Thermoanaerobaculia bacterium]